MIAPARPLAAALADCSRSSAWRDSRHGSLGDAIVATALLRWAPAADMFVSWDAKHFAGKVAARVVTSAQFSDRPHA